LAIVAPLIRVPATASAPDQEVAMTVVAIVIGAAVLVVACSTTVLRRRGRRHG
jgi:hypothetical protein